MNVTIRSGILSDYPRLVAYDEFIGDRRLDLQAGEVLVADADDVDAAAFVKIAPKDFMGWPLLAILCVQPTLRRQGIGRSLLAHIKGSERFPAVFTSTESSNLAMRELLDAVGARNVGSVDGLNLSGERELLYRLR